MMVGFIDTLSEIKEMNYSQNEPETMSSNRFDITTDSEDIDSVRSELGLVLFVTGCCVP